MTTPAGSIEERILVLMPSAQDAERTRALLSEAGLFGTPCADIEELCREIPRGLGAVLLADEALVGDGGTCLASALEDQPPWSDVPLVLLTREGSDGRYASFRESLNATLVERPVRMRTLLSVLRSALRARRHQYEVRDLLVTRARAEDAVRERDERLKLFLENATDYAVIISDLEDRVLEWLGGAGSITGWRAAEVLGQPVEFIFTPEDRAAGVPAAETRKAAETGRAPNTRWHERKDGSRFFAEGVTLGIRGPSGELRGFGKVFRDATARKLADERLTRDATLLASVHDAVIVTDLEGVVTYWNEGASQLFGWTADETVGRPYADRFEEPARSWVREEIRARAAGSEWSGEYEDYRKDGTRVWIDARVARITDSAGRPVGILGVSRDITERKRAEDALRASGERFRALVTTTSDVLYRMSADWREMKPLDGRDLVASNAEPIRDWMEKNIPGFEHARVRAAIEKAVSTKKPFELEHQVIGPDGTPGWTYSRAVPILDPAGDIVEWFGTASDITRRKEAEAALARVTAESERRKRLYETILSATPDFVYVFSLDHRVIYANDALIRMWGRTPEETFGKTFLEVGYEPWHAEMHDREIDQVRATKRPVRGEVPFTGTLGRRVYDYIFVPVIGADGEVEAVAGTTRDVTERKEAEEALRDADRKKDDFIALLAHELRNPLAPLRNGLQVIRLAPDRDSRDRAQQMMERQLSHMVRLIDDLLDISRISRNKMELRLARILLSDAVSSAVETARPAMEAAGHELTVSLPPDPVFLDADLTRLSQVFSNLLTNSAKYTERGGRVSLAARVEGDEVVLSVRDTGIGIPAESLPRIFDMFSQVDRSIERSTGGLGIGLALVKGLVEMHGGTVEAKSDGAGRGSEFTVRLPTVTFRSLRPETLHPSPNGASSGPGRRILVVDDNRDSAESMAEMLRLFGNEVTIAHDGEEALERARAFRPEVILMDVGMPRLNGYEATRRIREQPWGKDINIVALTGWGQDGDRARSREAGCDGHLVKPVALSDLQEVLSELR